ncbi:hypothetical protein ARMGADRAFT_1020251 [Armillaria gallica]|uniref:Uncharacterized protein n=1 Tax=Armillaria gallica TaxID=47427 RepID=A0A2H3CEK3_ARMGA|nr:hypothetical protein ARMGADRAFT_1020251 [Armillaria gallica]
MICRAKGEKHHAEDSEGNVHFVHPSSVLRPSFAPDISMEANSKPAWLTGPRVFSWGGEYQR